MYEQFPRPVLALLLAALAHQVQAQEEGRPDFDGWHLVFSDEFDGDRLEKGKWTTCYWWEDDGCTNLGNEELQWYLPGNVSVGGGALRLTARPEPAVGHEGRTFPFTSGLVTTGRYYGEAERADRFSLTYGYVEVRALAPSGQGLWPAVWMLPSDHRSRPEIDIMEVLGHRPDVLELHYHYDTSDGAQRAGHEVKTTDLSRAWHVYGVLWSPDAIVWYLDGREVWRYTDRRTISSEPMYLIINLAVGGNWPGPPDATTRFPATLLVDYVRIWQERAP